MPEGTALTSPEEVAGRLFSSLVNAFDLFAVYLGDRLGYYRALATDSMTSGQLAAATGTAERYAREWLEQQAVTGFLTVDDPTRPATERIFRLPDGYRALFVDPASPLSVTAAAQIFVGTVTPLPALLEAYRSGGGVPYAAYGADLAQGQADFNRPMLMNRLAQEYLPAMPDVHARLLAAPPARVADIGMGLGWSSIALAKGYPAIQVDGYDLDEHSVRMARENAEAEGVDDRVHFHVRDAGDADLAGTYDFALAVECVHDMADPVSALRAMRRLVGPGGTALVVDERAEDAFTPLGSDLERAFYGFSILHCLPVGMVDLPSAGTGTLMRQGIFREYAAEAGFRRVDILAVDCENFFFYRLTA